MLFITIYYTKSEAGKSKLFAVIVAPQYFYLILMANMVTVTTSNNWISTGR